MWFQSWDAVLRVVLSGVSTYALLVLLLRVSGKRTLSKLNAFDLVVTVAMGSTLSSALLAKDVRVADGLAGLLVLVACQYAIASASLRWQWVVRVVRSQPRLLLKDGEVRQEALDAERVTRGNVLAAVRQAGIARVEEVGAVVLETDGSMSVLPRTQGEATSLEGVRS
jgi:uncharacterized membrane protein YcaP (DUF421 family)